MKKAKLREKLLGVKYAAITKKEAATWIQSVAKDPRVPKDVRSMCEDIAGRLQKGPR